MDSLEILKDWIIPMGSVFLAIWFSASAKKDADRAQENLELLRKASESWQSQIIQSTISIIESTPQVVESKIALARSQSAEHIASTIQEILKDLSSGKTQGLSVHESVEMFKALSAQLSKALENVNESKT